jgi:hypothetical protein
MKGYEVGAGFQGPYSGWHVHPAPGDGGHPGTENHDCSPRSAQLMSHWKDVMINRIIGADRRTRGIEYGSRGAVIAVLRS